MKSVIAQSCLDLEAKEWPMSFNDNDRQLVDVHFNLFYVENNKIDKNIE